MYRNIVYNSSKKECIVFSWDENGNPKEYTVPFKPYIYLLTNNKNHVDAYSIYNEPLVKKEFDTQSERYRFLTNYEYPRIYNNLDVQQQCLVDLFWNQNETESFSKNLLNIGFFDIETYSPNGFPTPFEANDEINAITLYSTYTKKYYVFGCKPFNNKWEDVEYLQCDNEHKLLQLFVEYVNKLRIDVLAAWNGEGFDFPYICNRIGRICGDNWLKKISPVCNEVWKPVSKRDVIGNRGEDIQKWSIEGLSLIDYMLVYKKYTYVDRASFALNYIANIELGDQKIEHNGLGLHELADKDWQKFIEYNIQDVRLLVALDEKLKFINLLKMQAYIGLTTLEKALGTTSVTLGAVAIRARYANKYLHTKIKFNDGGDYVGGYVAEPVAGFHDNIVSYDANSLYPNTVISLNISPETKLGKIIQEDDNFVWFKSNKDNKIIKADKQQFLDKCKKNNIAISKANVLFSQTQQGILAEFMDYYYQGRVKTKKALKETYKLLDKCETEEEKRKINDRIEYLDLLQLAQKIVINSAYGSFGCSFFPLNDIDLSSSITLTGQDVVKQANNIIIDFCGKSINSKLNNNEVVIYNDTDSCYISLTKVFEYLNIKLLDDNGEITKEAWDQIYKLDDYINEKITEYAKSEYNSIDPRFVFKREVVADKGFFIKKKRYAVHVIDDEGKKVKKLKFKGIDIVRNTMPEKVKPLAKKWLECMVVERDRLKCNNILKNIFETFKTMTLEELSFTINCSNMEKYVKPAMSNNRIDGFTESNINEFAVEPHCPYHISAANNYNVILRKEGLEKKYDLINSGDKVSIIYVEENNKYNKTCIAYKNVWPKEFNNIFKIDYNKIYDKIIDSMVERFYETVLWESFKPSNSCHTDLFSFLSDE